MKKLTTILSIILFSTTTLAENPERSSNIYVLGGGFSKHFKDSRPNGQSYNEVNNNIGLEYETPVSIKGFKVLSPYVGGMVQYMKNSLDNDSIVFGADVKNKWKLTDNGDWQAGIGLFAGAQNGYPKVSEGRDEEDLVPVAYPFAEVSYKAFGAYGTCVPKVYASGFCFLGFKARAYSFY